MPVPLKPHTATVTPRTFTESGDIVTGYTDGSTATVRGILTEKNPLEVMEAWGIAATFPATFLCDVGSGIAIGDKLTVLGSDYRVLAGPQTVTTVSLLTHERFLVERHGV